MSTSAINTAEKYHTKLMEELASNYLVPPWKLKKNASIFLTSRLVRVTSARATFPGDLNFLGEKDIHSRLKMLEVNAIRNDANVQSLHCEFFGADKYCAKLEEEAKAKDKKYVVWKPYSLGSKRRLVGASHRADNDPQLKAQRALAKANL